MALMPSIFYNNQMNRIIVALFCILSLPVFAQKDKDVTEKVKIDFKAPKDRLAIDLNFCNWIHNQENGFQTKWYGRGISIYYYYDIQIKKSRVSFAPGLGFSSSNIYHNSLLIDTNGISFTPLSANTTPKESDVKNNKISLNYIDIPLELRIRTNPDKHDNMVKFAIGFKAGFRIDAHTKMRIKNSEENKVYKEKRFPDFNVVRCGPTLRIGYSAFNVTAYYGILGVFKNNRGPQANEFSVGISFNGL